MCYFFYRLTKNMSPKMSHETRSIRNVSKIQIIAQHLSTKQNKKRLVSKGKS